MKFKLEIELSDDEYKFVKDVRLIKNNELSFNMFDNFDVYNSLFSKGIIYGNSEFTYFSKLGNQLKKIITYEE